MRGIVDRTSESPTRLDDTEHERSTRGFRSYLVSFVVSRLALQIAQVAVGWHIYAITHQVFDLGLIGLVLFVPSLILWPVAGHAADRFDRRAVVAAMFGVEALVAIAFGVLAMTGVRDLTPYLVALLASGIGRAFLQPALASLLPTIVPRERLLQAQATANSIRELVVIAGPALGGVLITLGSAIAFYTSGVLMLLSTALLWTVPSVRDEPREREPLTWTSILAGVRFIRDNRIIAGAILLDLFAVLFGGATALLPVYAQSILHVGPLGLGILRSAPAVGAGLCAAYLARRRLVRGVGRTLFVCVAGFGLATIVFGLSRSVWVSVGALIVLGGFDMVSVVIRQGLVQLNTPNGLRGRVSAVSSMFVGASNELGAFESGSVAALVGTVGSVVAGGVATIAIVAISRFAFPDLWHAEKLDQEAA